MTDASNPGTTHAANELTRLTAIITQQQADLRTLAGAVRPNINVFTPTGWVPAYSEDPTRDAAIAAALQRARSNSNSPESETPNAP